MFNWVLFTQDGVFIVKKMHVVETPLLLAD